MLLFVGGGHHIADFGVGENRHVSHQRAFVLHHGGKSRQGHVESNLMQIVEPHRFMCKPCVAECAVDGVFAFQNLMDGSMESRGVDDFGGVQIDAVEL